MSAPSFANVFAIGFCAGMAVAALQTGNMFGLAVDCVLIALNALFLAGSR